jgi:hypothetical protein
LGLTCNKMQTFYKCSYIRVTRRPVFEWVVPSSRQIWNGTPYSPVFFQQCHSISKLHEILHYTSIIYGRHMLAIRMPNNSNWHTDHYLLSANLNSAKKEYLEPPALFPNVKN